MELFIKHMESTRCKTVVKQELEKLGLNYISVNLGRVELSENITQSQWHQLNVCLSIYGLELIDDKHKILIEKISVIIIELIHFTEDLPTINYSAYISKKLNYDYTYLSNIFSQAKGITIQQFIIKNKIERVKDWLLFGELNLTEISNKLHYSSVAHLSNQFKKVTGCTPTIYKQQKQNKHLYLNNM